MLAPKRAPGGGKPLTWGARHLSSDLSCACDPPCDRRPASGEARVSGGATRSSPSQDGPDQRPAGAVEAPVGFFFGHSWSVTDGATLGRRGGSVRSDGIRRPRGRAHPLPSTRRRRIAFTTGSGEGQLPHEAGLEQKARRVHARRCPTASPRTYAARCGARSRRPSSSISPATCAFPPRRATHLVRTRPSRAGPAGRSALRADRGLPGSHPRRAPHQQPRLLRDLRAAAADPAAAREADRRGDVVVDAKSGTTGAGRAPREDLLFSEVADDFSAYAPGRAHRHVGEMEAVLQERTGRARPASPSVRTSCPCAAGSCPRSTSRPPPARTRCARPAARAYEGSPFVRVRRRAAAPVRRRAHQRMPDLRARGGARGGRWSSPRSTTS